MLAAFWVLSLQLMHLAALFGVVVFLCCYWSLLCNIIHEIAVSVCGFVYIYIAASMCCFYGRQPGCFVRLATFLFCSASVNRQREPLIMARNNPGCSWKGTSAREKDMWECWAKYKETERPSGNDSLMGGGLWRGFSTFCKGRTVFCERRKFRNIRSRDAKILY